MKEGWEMKKLGDVCKTGAGGTPLKNHKEYYENGSIPWIRSGEVNNRNILESKIKITDEGLNNSSAKLFPAKTVVIAMYGATAGQVGILNFECATNQAVCGIMPNENFIPEFLYYFFLNFKEELIAQAVGNAQPNISQAKIKNTLVPIISVKNQKKVVALLDEAFTKIDQAKTNIEKNIENAKELFQSKLNEIFSQRGEGWEEKTLLEACLKITDGAHHSPKMLYPDEADGLYPYVTSKNIRNNYMDFSKLQYVDEDFHKPNFARCSPELGDVLLTKDGANTGNVTINTLDKPFSLLSSVALIKTNKEILLPGFLKYYIQSPLGFKNITGKMTGAAIKRIILRNIKSAKIVVPIIEKQDKYIANINKILKQSELIISKNAEKIENLEELKKSILQKAFSGELTKSETLA